METHSYTSNIRTRLALAQIPNEIILSYLAARARILVRAKLRIIVTPMLGDRPSYDANMGVAKIRNLERARIRALVNGP